MAREEQGRNNQPAPQQEQYPHLSEPVVIFDGNHAVTVSHNPEKNRMEVHITAGDVLLQSLAVMPNNDVHTINPFEKHARPQSAPTQKETVKPAAKQETLLAEEAGEYPPITLEGVPVKAASYNKEEHTYYLRLAHHPDPNDKTKAVFYDLRATGAKADECYAARITHTKMGVHVTGDDLSRMVTKRKGGEPELKREIRITSLETFKDRPDSPVVHMGKVLLADFS